MAYLLNTYNSYLTTRPLITKVLTSGTIAALGDFICQNLEGYGQRQQYQQNKSFDWNRITKFFLIGALFIAPFLHINYTYVLPNLIGHEKGLNIAIRKIIFDQIVLAPTYFFLFYNVINRFEGKNQDEINQQLGQKFWPTMLMNWRVWPIINFLNFLWVPIPYQVLWNNFFSMFFNAYLSYMHHSYEQRDWNN